MVVRVACLLSMTMVAVELSSTVYGLLAFFLFLFFYFLIFCSSSNPNYRNLPPQAGGARHILGHLHLMDGSGGQLPHVKLGTVADNLGPIFTIRLGRRRAVVVSSCKIAKQLFTACDAVVSDRPKSRAIEILSYNFVMFGFAPYGAYWREIRKVIAVEFLSSRRVELMSHVCAEEVSRMVREMYARWEKGEKDGSGRVLVDLKKWFEELNLNLILRVVAGKRVDDDNETRRLGEVLRNFFELVGMFVAADAVPWLRWLDLGGHEKRMKETATAFDGIMGKWLEEHRRKEDSGEDRKDFIDVMLRAIENSNFGGEFDTDMVIKTTCQEMILGGSDTSSVALTWALSLLLNNQHVLIQAQEELDKHVGKGRLVKQPDIHNLMYLQSIIKETLRLHPPLALGPVREFTQDCNVEGYNIPKGTWLILNTQKIQRDPKIWLNSSLEFNPERFIGTHRNVDFKGHDFQLIPFGVGRRMCPGLNLATHMLHLALANLLQAFDVTKVSAANIDMTESMGLTNPKATPLEVLISPRLPPTLY